MGNSPAIHHRLDDIEEVEFFYSAIQRQQLTKELSPDRPYTYWTIELYDQRNGIRGGGGLGVLAADMRRVAEQNNVPLVLITPFYPSEPQQSYQNLQPQENHKTMNYADYGFNYIDTVNLKCCGNLCHLDVIEKILGSTRLLCVTEPNFGELYAGESSSDHRLYQEVALGFGGYQALKLVGLKPAIMQLNEVATFFAALARLDELISNGMDFYEAVVYTRKHTLYTNHTLVQAAEAEFSLEQFERFVFPNLKAAALRQWLYDKFRAGWVKLSSVTIEISELRSGVSKLHARLANYRDIAGDKVRFKAITNGIDLQRWTLPATLQFYQEQKLLNQFNLPCSNYEEQLPTLSATVIRGLKNQGRKELNAVLQRRLNQYGASPDIPPDALIFSFKRRFVDYKRPTLPFTDLERLSRLLEEHNAYYVLSGRVHLGDQKMAEELAVLLQKIDQNPALKKRVHYLPDYDEELAYALAVGANVFINTPVVGLEACGTSWMKDMINLGLVISTHDGGIADVAADNYLNIVADNVETELELLYQRMDEAAEAWMNDFDLEYWVQRQLQAYLSIISGTRMLKDYLNYIFK